VRAAENITFGRDSNRRATTADSTRPSELLEGGPSLPGRVADHRSRGPFAPWSTGRRIVPGGYAIGRRAPRGTNPPPPRYRCRKELESSPRSFRRSDAQRKKPIQLRMTTTTTSTTTQPITPMVGGGSVTVLGRTRFKSSNERHETFEPLRRPITRLFEAPTVGGVGGAAWSATFPSCFLDNGSLRFVLGRRGPFGQRHGGRLCSRAGPFPKTRATAGKPVLGRSRIQAGARRRDWRTRSAEGVDGSDAPDLSEDVLKRIVHLARLANPYAADIEIVEYALDLLGPAKLPNEILALLRPPFERVRGIQQPNA